MASLEDVRLIPRVRLADARGWLLKVIEGSEEGLPTRTGEVYVTLAHPGQVRGGHYHLEAAEWFTVIKGEADIRLTVPGGGETRALRLSAEQPATLFVPPGIAHAFRNASETEEMLLLAYASVAYDPGDTVPYTLE